MTCTDDTTSIGRLMAGPPVTGSVTFALFTSAPLCVLRVPLRLIIRSERGLRRLQPLASSEPPDLEKVPPPCRSPEARQQQHSCRFRPFLFRKQPARRA